MIYGAVRRLGDSLSMVRDKGVDKQQDFVALQTVS